MDRVRSFYCLPIVPNERAVFGNAICVIQFDDAALAKMVCRLFGGVR